MKLLEGIARRLSRGDPPLRDQGEQINRSCRALE